jgi:hypothetical protein
MLLLKSFVRPCAQCGTDLIAPESSEYLWGASVTSGLARRAATTLKTASVSTHRLIQATGQCRGHRSATVLKS